LFAPGCLGTCWYGKYHYLEPYAGCEHDCHCCYARLRSEVRDSLAALGSEFQQSVPLYPRDELIAQIRKETSGGSIRIVKLSRYTDIFSPAHVRSGLAHEILATLVDSPVQRVILTTKGVPDEPILALIETHAAKFSYNVVAKPKAPVCLENTARPVHQRLVPAERLAKAGVLTTIHMDPLVVGLEDDPKRVCELLTTLKKMGLMRVMFSFLLVNEEISSLIEARLGTKAASKVRASYDFSLRNRYLPEQEETQYIAARAELQEAATRTISALLTEMGFSFVLCGLKNITKIGVDAKACPRCDGTFYA